MLRCCTSIKVKSNKQSNNSRSSIRQLTTALTNAGIATPTPLTFDIFNCQLYAITRRRFRQIHSYYEQ